MKLINIENLTLKYQTFEVLKDISFSVDKGDYIAVVGPNGAGKTTLVRAILGLVDIYQGKVEFYTDKIGYLQQKVSLNDSKFPASVKEIIKSGLLISKKFPKIYKKEDEIKVNEIVKNLRIDHLSNKLIGNLSGGELQKVLLARSLISNPEIIFLDEPTTALDPNSRDEFYRLLKELNEKNSVTIILISHDMGSVGKYAKKMVYIDGRLIFYGTFDEFCKSENMESYFGNVSQHLFCQRHN